MHVFSLLDEQEWNPKKHVEKVLGTVAEGDVTVACWEPGQISPNHCHPDATEIYFCFSGGGKMRTPTGDDRHRAGRVRRASAGRTARVHNGPARTLLFRVRYGADMSSRHFGWPSNPDWKQKPRDAEYFREHPPA